MSTIIRTIHLNEPTQGAILHDGDTWTGNVYLPAGQTLAVTLETQDDFVFEILDPDGDLVGYSENPTAFTWVAGIYSVKVSGYGSAHSDKPFTLTVTAAPKAWPKPLSRGGRPVTAVICHGPDQDAALQWEFILRDAQMDVQHIISLAGNSHFGNLLVLASDALLADNVRWLKSLGRSILAIGQAGWQMIPPQEGLRAYPITGRRVRLPLPALPIFRAYYRKADPPPLSPWPIYEQPRPMLAVDGLNFPDSLAVADHPDGILMCTLGATTIYSGLVGPPRYMTAEGRMLVANAAWTIAR